MMRIVEPGSTAWTTAAVDGAAVLIDAANYFEALYAACLRAESFILLSGWQFDTRVDLVRGSAAAKSETHTGLLLFLNDLCAQKPNLHVYILAWDFSVIYTLEREWMQKLSFEWRAHERVHFTFDACVPSGAAHHQKFAAIDGAIGFVGSSDLAEHRWDDRHHAPANPLRTLADGTAYPPYHEVNAVFTGEAVQTLVQFFGERWKRASEDPWVVEPRATAFEIPPMRALALPARELSFSRTQIAPHGEAACEVRELFVRAIASAERLIYVESQYFSARAVTEAFAARFTEDSRPKLDVVIILPLAPEGRKEAAALGVAQAEAIAHLRQLAGEQGHRLGVYSSVTEVDGRDVATYIHAKMFIVDDRFVTLGSANVNNRSMGVDTELNVSFETSERAGENVSLGRAIRRLRVSLLAEHAGLSGAASIRKLVDPRDLVTRLDALASDPHSRLRHCELPNPANSDALVDVVSTSIGQYLDPEEPGLDDALGDGSAWREVFTRGVSCLRERMTATPVDPTDVDVDPTVAVDVSRQRRND